LHAAVGHDDERGGGVDAEALGELGVFSHVDAAKSEGVVVAPTLEYLREEGIDSPRSSIGGVVEEQQLSSCLPARGRRVLDDASLRMARTCVAGVERCCSHSPPFPSAPTTFAGRKPQNLGRAGFWTREGHEGTASAYPVEARVQ
jgi:hypothetical protein